MKLLLTLLVSTLLLTSGTVAPPTPILILDGSTFNITTITDANHEGQCAVLMFVNEKGEHRIGDLISVPKNGPPKEMDIKWLTRSGDDPKAWGPEQEWITEKGADGKVHELKIHAVVNTPNPNEDLGYHFEFVLRNPEDKKETKRFWIGITGVTGTIWWVKKVGAKPNGELYFELSKTKPDKE